MAPKPLPPPSTRFVQPWHPYGRRRVRPTRVVASAALIAALASVAISASAGSWAIPPAPSFDPRAFTAVGLEDLATRSGVTATPTTDPALVSADQVGPGDVLSEPNLPLPTGAPVALGVVPRAIVVTVAVQRSTGGSTLIAGGWHHDAEDSWYGPGFYGQHTACGEVLTETLMGVANRTLPCGTLVTFRNPANGQTVTVPVVDRGPYVSGRTWDLTKGTCLAISHCYTGPLDWRLP